LFSWLSGAPASRRDFCFSSLKAIIMVRSLPGRSLSLSNLAPAGSGSVSGNFAGTQYQSPTGRTSFYSRGSSADRFISCFPPGMAFNRLPARLVVQTLHHLIARCFPLPDIFLPFSERASDDEPSSLFHFSPDSSISQWPDRFIGPGLSSFPSSFWFTHDQNSAVLLGLLRVDLFPSRKVTTYFLFDLMTLFFQILPLTPSCFGPLVISRASPCASHFLIRPGSPHWAGYPFPLMVVFYPFSLYGFAGSQIDSNSIPH